MRGALGVSTREREKEKKREREREGVKGVRWSSGGGYERVASFCEENDEGLGKELAEFEVE